MHNNELSRHSLSANKRNMQCATVSSSDIIVTSQDERIEIDAALFQKPRMQKRGGYEEVTRRLRGGYEEATRRLRGGYEEATRRLRGGYEEVAREGEQRPKLASSTGLEAMARVIGGGALQDLPSVEEASGEEKLRPLLRCARAAEVTSTPSRARDSGE
jgi:hypothetical protein